MATLTVQNLDEDGIVRDTDSDIFVAADEDGDEFINDGRTLFIAMNSGVASRTLTFTAQKTTVKIPGYGNDLTVPNLTLTLDMTGNQPMGLIVLPAAAYNDGNGKVQVTYSDEADLKVCAFKLARV